MLPPKPHTYIWLKSVLCVSNYPNIFFIISLTRKYIFNYLRHSLLILQNNTSQCFRKIHSLFVGGSEFSRSLAPLHCFAFRTYTVGNIRIPKIPNFSHTHLYCIFTSVAYRFITPPPLPVSINYWHCLVGIFGSVLRFCQNPTIGYF